MLGQVHHRGSAELCLVPDAVPVRDRLDSTLRHHAIYCKRLALAMARSVVTPALPAAASIPVSSTSA